MPKPLRRFPRIGCTLLILAVKERGAPNVRKSKLCEIGLGRPFHARQIEYQQILYLVGDSQTSIQKGPKCPLCGSIPKKF